MNVTVDRRGTGWVLAFPALGFDPAPGDPAALAAAARSLRTVGDGAAGAGAAAARLDSSGWTGSAGDGFRGQLAPLPADLDRVSVAHRRAAAALDRYGAGLVRRQRRAAELEAWAAAVPAEDEDALREVVAQARRLGHEHTTAAAEAAAAIRAATDPPYRRPGRLARALGTVRSWVRDHADSLTHISTVLKGVSAALGTVSLVPGMHFLAPFAVLAGAAATTIDVAVRIATGRGSWAGLALDAALTALPAGPVARAVKRLPGVTRALRAANRAIPGPVKGRLFRAAGNLPDGVDRDRLRAAATLIREQAAHYGDDVIVQGSRAGWSARAASDIDIGLRVSPERFEEVLRARFGDPVSVEFAGFLAACRDKGIIHVRRAGLRSLGVELESVLGHKVDLSVIRRGGRFDQEPWLPL